MFGFAKKKAPAAPSNEAHDAVSRKLDETDTRLSEALKEMRRRLEEKERRALSLVGVGK